ncbi:MAG: hypothetical protein HY471_02945 [Candidatus Sungbacteria bacterium]|nr:hypothetical protein [Candidatus Sungbacteria bacterium]
MTGAEIQEYIKKQLAVGASKEEIKRFLSHAGCSESELEAAFAEVERSIAAASPATAPPPLSAPPPQSVPSLPSTSAPQAEPPAAPVQDNEARHIFASRRILFTSVGGVLGVLLLAGGGYAYVAKLGPFARPPYVEKNLLSGLLAAMSRIDTASYLLSASLAVEERDTDAKPFAIAVSDEFRGQYSRDAKRAADISGILEELRSLQYQGGFPSSLEQLVSLDGRSRYGRRISITDAKTGKPYEYSRTEGGKNFSLVVTFETNDALEALKQSFAFSTSITPIQERTATFTKDSSSYFYLPAEPPKPLLAQWGEFAAFISPSSAASLSVRAATDWRNRGAADWSFNADATGDFGDLAYKFNFEALKKNLNYYFRLNNMPSIFSAGLTGIKGQWIKVAPQATSSSPVPYDDLLQLTQRIPEAERVYKEEQEEFRALLKTVAEIADEEGLLSFVTGPVSEWMEGRRLYRYDIEFEKNAVLEFYRRFSDNVARNKLLKSVIVDPGYIRYLESPEFDEAFDYYQKNTRLTLWADPEGFPAIITYAIRIVPFDGASHLKEKQIKITFKIVLSNINEPLHIEAPEGAKPLEDVMKTSNRTGPAVKSRDARRITDIKQLQLAAELYFDAKGGYPSRLDELAPSYLSQFPMDPLDKLPYRYTYQTAPGGQRQAYHLGASLEDSGNSGLFTDSDCDSTTGIGCPGRGTWGASGAFRGADDTGCGEESNRFCYDVTP